MSDEEQFLSSFMKSLESKDTAKLIRLSHIKGELKEHLPQIDRLFDIPERPDFHPEGNTGMHTLLALEEVKDADPMVKYAMLVHDLGKIVTFDAQVEACEQKGEPYDAKSLTKHFGHAEKGLPLVSEVSDKLNVPEDWKEFAGLVCKQHMKAHDFDKMKDAKLYEFNQEVPDKYFKALMACCQADELSRDISEDEKNKIREGQKAKQQRVVEVRNYMVQNPNEDKEAFANNFAKYKKQQTQSNDKSPDYNR